jgi:hypothetical protein
MGEVDVGKARARLTHFAAEGVRSLSPDEMSEALGWGFRLIDEIERLRSLLVEAIEIVESKDPGEALMDAILKPRPVDNSE